MSSTAGAYLERVRRRDLARFREDAEEWRAAHEHLERSLWELEDCIDQGLRCLDRIDRAWEKLGLGVSKDLLAVGGELYLRRRILLVAWLATAKGIADLVAQARDEYGDVQGADEFTRRVAEIEDRVNTPRPVEIDAEGRITTATGERILMRGLEPAAILRSLNDVAAGRWRSLQEVVDSHGRTGV